MPGNRRSTSAGAEVGDVDQDAAGRRPAAGHDLQVARRGTTTSRVERSMPLRVVALHVALAERRCRGARPRRAAPPRAPRRSSASAPASSPVGWNCIISMSRTGEPGAQAHGQAVAGLLPGRRRDPVHRRRAAGGDHDDAGAHQRRTPRGGRRARDDAAELAVGVEHQVERPVRPPARAAPIRNIWSRSRPMISMPVRSPRWTVRSNDWPANAFWWIRPSGRAVEEAADAGLELVDHARARR